MKASAERIIDLAVLLGAMLTSKKEANRDMCEILVQPVMEAADLTELLEFAEQKRLTRLLGQALTQLDQWPERIDECACVLELEEAVKYIILRLFPSVQKSDVTLQSKHQNKAEYAPSFYNQGIAELLNIIPPENA